MTRGDLLALAAAIVSAGIFATAGSLILPVLTLNLEARGHSSAVIGAFGAMLGLTAMLGTPFSPRIVRRLGAGKALFVLLLAVAAVNLAYKPFEHSLAAWFAIYFAASLALGLIFVVAETVITTLAPPARRGFILGLYAMGFSFGCALGPVVGRFTGIEGWTPFVVASGLAAAAAALVWTADIKKSAVPAERKSIAETFNGFKKMLAITALPFVCAFSLGAAEISVYDLMPVYARKIEYSIDDAFFLLTVFSVGAFVVLPALGALADKFNPRRTLAAVAGFGVLGAAALPFLLGGGIAAAEWDLDKSARMACLGLWGGLLLAVYPLGLAQAARFFPPPNLAAANALFGFSYGGGMLFGPALTGVLMDISPHGIAPALAFFASLPLFALLRRKSGKKTPPAP